MRFIDVFFIIMDFEYIFLPTCKFLIDGTLRLHFIHQSRVSLFFLIPLYLSSLFFSLSLRYTLHFISQPRDTVLLSLLNVSLLFLLYDISSRFSPFFCTIPHPHTLAASHTLPTPFLYPLPIQNTWNILVLPWYSLQSQG